MADEKIIKYVLQTDYLMYRDSPDSIAAVASCFTLPPSSISGLLTAAELWQRLASKDYIRISNHNG